MTRIFAVEDLAQDLKVQCCVVNDMADRPFLSRTNVSQGSVAFFDLSGGKRTGRPVSTLYTLLIALAALTMATV